ncbi:MAG: HDOD domain-containing protein [Gammaproteobacteria bacterium]
MVASDDTFVLDDTEDGTELTKEDKLALLLKRIHREPEYPGIAKHISEITNKTAPENAADALDLSTAILKDYALTSKLLKLVNSASFSQYGGQISTISRAIIILGFEQVRATALSILLFDHLSSSEQADALNSASCSAFLSGILAREIANDFKIEPEEAYITSLFHKLGKQMVIYYFSDEYRRIELLLKDKKIKEPTACRKTLGVSYPELGMAIAKEWQLSESIISGMSPPRISGNNLTSAQLNAHLASCTNEIAAVAGKTNDLKSQDFRPITDRYKLILKLDPEYVCKLVKESVPELTAFAEILQSSMTSSGYYKKLTNTENEKVDPNSNTEQNNQDDKTDIKNPSDKKTDPAILMDGFTEISNTLLGDFELNDLINMILETIYRGMGFERVVFCLKDNRKNLIFARFGLGLDIENIIPNFKYPIKAGSDLFNVAINKHRDFVVIDSADIKYQGQVPSWCKKLTNPFSLVAFPIITNKKCIGLLYADTQNANTTFSADEIKMFGNLRNQAALAFQQKQTGK